MAGPVKFTWVVPPSVLGKDCDRRAEAIPREMSFAMQVFAADISADMKANHPWENQTGEAEAGLYAMATGGSNPSIVAGGKAPHQIFLELGTRFMAPRAIIGPTLKAYHPKVRTEMNRIAGSG